MTSYSAAVCENCLIVGMNDDRSGVGPDDPEPLGLLGDGDHIVGLDEPDDEMWFSWSRCDGCGGLPGNRLTVIVATS